MAVQRGRLALLVLAFISSTPATRGSGTPVHVARTPGYSVISIPSYSPAYFCPQTTVSTANYSFIAPTYALTGLLDCTAGGVLCRYSLSASGGLLGLASGKGCISSATTAADYAQDGGCAFLCPAYTALGALYGAAISSISMTDTSISCLYYDGGTCTYSVRPIDSELWSADCVINLMRLVRDVVLRDSDWDRDFAEAEIPTGG
ncbi:hypothetical protein HMN09_00355900 [Mycena chlorophos]|uniref:Uncharacterized protein n=1 Tax=Mycena chlorophos TaxID=658473 RepID=A0A8H6WI35_MYCCL|nr:hypothetical protein HMN09_00355900 [Mycena chlorophos]